MLFMKPLKLFFVLFALAACEASAPDFSPPDASGLIGIRPYPGPEDVCQIIGENARTAQYLDDSALLVGCPLSETGAIADRKAEGGTVVDQAGSWVLLSIPFDI